VTEEYLTVQDAAAALGITEVSVRSALNRSRLPFVEKYGRKLIARADLDAYRQRTQPDGVKKVGRPQGTRNKPKEPEMRNETDN